MIMVLDDSSEIQKVFQIMLQRNGYISKTVSSSGELQQLLEKVLPHILFLDVLLINEDGRDVCAALKADEKFKDIYIILMSARTNLLEDFATHKADDFLPKPFDMDILLKKIDSFYTARALPEKND